MAHELDPQREQLNLFGAGVVHPSGEMHENIPDKMHLKLEKCV